MRFLLVFLTVFALSTPAWAAGMAVEYKDGDTVLEGYWADSQCEGATDAPVVLVVHQWMGLTDYEKMRTDMLAAQCYNAFAIDMYGKGIRPSSKEEAGKLASLYKGDPALARKRLDAALTAAKTMNGRNYSKIAAFGYCFGGGMVLELARSGADINGVVSFHGTLSASAPAKPGEVKAAVQVHQGAADPFVPQDEVKGFMNEMDKAGADWTLTQYAGAVHAFTQQGAGNDVKSGTAYNEKADTRSWAAALNFLDEIFAK